MKAVLQRDCIDFERTKKVKKVLFLKKKQLVNAKTEKDKTYYENKCSTLDRQIDQLPPVGGQVIYELYGLTEEEIGIVEGG